MEIKLNDLDSNFIDNELTEILKIIKTRGFKVTLTFEPIKQTKEIEGLTDSMEEILKMSLKDKGDEKALQSEILKMNKLAKLLTETENKRIDDSPIKDLTFEEFNSRLDRNLKTGYSQFSLEERLNILDEM